MKKNQSAETKNAAKPSAFSGLGDVLGAGFGDLMKEGDQLAEVNLNDISIKPQVRTEMEDEENLLSDLTNSIKKHGVFQPILLRPVANGEKPYELVAGERRYICSGRAGKVQIPALIREMTDEELEEMQFAENVQRKNLTQIEEAKRIQKDLDDLGSVDAVLEKHSKSRAWLSKILSLLSLPEQAKRVISEKISADVEVINNVKTIEKIDPAAAKILVDDLKKTRGKEDARKKTNEVKEKVKPSKKAPKKDSDNVATAPDLSSQEPGEVTTTNGEQNGTDWPFEPKGNGAITPPALPPSKVLDKAYSQIFDKGTKPKTVIDGMSKDDRENAESWLNAIYDAGKSAENMSLAVIQGFRKGTFTADGYGAFALLAFLQGADESVKNFSMLNIFGLAKE